MTVKTILHEVAKKYDNGNEAYLELYSEERPVAKSDKKITVYVLTYLTHISFDGGEEGFACNNSEEYLDLGQATDAFSTRLNSSDPFRVSDTYSWEIREEVEAALTGITIKEYPDKVPADWRNTKEEFVIVGWQTYDHDDGEWFTFETEEEAKEVWPNNNVRRPIYARASDANTSSLKE